MRRATARVLFQSKAVIGVVVHHFVAVGTKRRLTYPVALAACGAHARGPTCVYRSSCARSAQIIRSGQTQLPSERVVVLPQDLHLCDNFLVDTN